MTELLTGLRQPDQRSCGAASLVAARMLVEPSFAVAMTPAAFRDEVLSLHRRVTGRVDARGRAQLPWPRALGTPPWAVAHHLSALDPGHRYVARLVLDRSAAFDRLAARVPTVLYVGNRWLPRHVVLVVEASPTSLLAFEPSAGRLVPVRRVDLCAGRLRLAGWDRPWFTVT